MWLAPALLRVLSWHELNGARIFSRPLKLGFGGSGQIHAHWTLQRAITYLLLMALIDGVPEHDIWCLPRA